MRDKDRDRTRSRDEKGKSQDRDRDRRDREGDRRDRDSDRRGRESDRDRGSSRRSYYEPRFKDEPRTPKLVYFCYKTFLGPFCCVKCIDRCTVLIAPKMPYLPCQWHRYCFETHSQLQHFVPFRANNMP